MALNITKASDPVHVDQIVVTLYSPPGVGKTSLGFTSDDALLLDFDGGVYRSANRGDSVPVKSWADVFTMGAEDLSGYKTIVVDTVGRALDYLSLNIIGRDPKAGSKTGTLTLQGYGKLKGEFSSWLKLVRSFGADVVLLAHADEQRSGDDVIERIDAQGSSKNEIYKCSDAMGRLAIRGGKRVLLFSPSDTSFGKNPANLDPVPVPTFDSHSRFLGDVIRTIKAKLNTMSDDQREIAALLAGWHERVVASTTPAAMTALLAEVGALDVRIHDNAKRVLWSHAKDHGVNYEAGTFVQQQGNVTPIVPTGTSTPAGNLFDAPKRSKAAF